LIKEVYLTHLQGANIRPSNAVITERYGVDETGLWMAFEGRPKWGGVITEWDPVRCCGPGVG